MQPRLIKTLLSLLAVPMINACAVSGGLPVADGVSVTPISIQQAQADQNLTLDKALFSSVDPQRRVIRWGGTVARIHNLADGRTEIELVSRPLNLRGRPVHSDHSDGRFLAIVPGFLDPEIIKPGRDVTVLGYLVQRYQGQVGESDYIFPVIAVIEHHLWQKRPVIQPMHFPHWNDRYRDPFWDDWPFPPPGRRP